MLLFGHLIIPFKQVNELLDVIVTAPGSGFATWRHNDTIMYVRNSSFGACHGLPRERTFGLLVANLAELSCLPFRRGKHISFARLAVHQLIVHPLLVWKLVLQHLASPRIIVTVRSHVCFLTYCFQSSVEQVLELCWCISRGLSLAAASARSFCIHIKVQATHRFL